MAAVTMAMLNLIGQMRCDLESVMYILQGISNKIVSYVDPIIQKSRDKNREIVTKYPTCMFQLRLLPADLK